VKHNVWGQCEQGPGAFSQQAELPSGAKIVGMDEGTRVEIELKLAQAQLATADALLSVKTARWYELVIFGGAGITIGLGIAQVFLR